MKQSLYFIIWLLVFSIVYSCNDRSESNAKVGNEEWRPEADSLYAHGALLKSLVYIDEQDARDLARSYNRHIRPRLGVNTQQRGSGIWFDSSVIRQLYEALYTGPAKDRLDGVR